MTTDPCNQPPEFDQASYDFYVSEDAANRSDVGTVSATDPDSQDTVTYTISGGNQAGKFAVDGNNGGITVAGELDYETAGSYTLTVEAGDGRGGSDTVTVNITVTDVPENAHPAPDGLVVSLSGGTFTVTWNAMTGASRYQVQQMIEGSGEDWADVEVTTGTSSEYSPSGGPACGSTYQFQVRAYGDGVVYAEVWGAYTSPATHTSEACNQTPEFDDDPYGFTVSEDTAAGGTVGSVSATDLDQGDVLTYSITGGNEAGKFDLNGSSGEITVAGGLDYETEPSYSLTVEVGDGRGGTDTASVGITVTDVAEDAAPAPEGLSVALADGVFTLMWSEVSGADRYEAQHRASDTDDWTALPETEGTISTYIPEGGPACGTTYQFRVRSYGDGVDYAADWGGPTEAETHETKACNAAPDFAPDTYSFTVDESVLTGTLVGTVSATDLDGGDVVSYSITAGNEDGRFAIAKDTGTITLAAALDYSVATFYTLTVRAEDGNGGEGNRQRQRRRRIRLPERRRGTRPRQQPRPGGRLPHPVRGEGHVGRERQP